MCIVTDENDVVKSVSLIPGVGNMPESWNCYFPVINGLPKEGDIWMGTQLSDGSCIGSWISN